MRNALPRRPRLNESGIINLDNFDGPGTHWTAYKKIRNKVYWFDSFGDLAPPLEVISYFNGSRVYYNYDKYQTFGSVNCGHLCLKFLTNMIKPKIWKINT